MWYRSYKSHKNGKEVIHYQFMERYKDPLSGKTRTASVSYDRNTPHSRKAAAKALSEKIDKIVNQDNRINKQITLKEFSDIFKASYKKRVSTGTYHYAKNTLKIFGGYFGNDTLLYKIKTIELNKFFNWRLYEQPRPLKNATVLIDRNVLNQLFRYAVQFGYLKDNPVSKAQITFKNERDRIRKRIEDKYLTPEEFEKIIEYCKRRHKQYYADAFTLQYLTGMRFGELAALQVKDIIKKGNHTYLKIEGTMDWENKVKSTMTKTVAGMRTIILSSKAAEIVDRRAKGKSKDEFLILTDKKKVYAPHPLMLTATNLFLKACAEHSKIKKHLTTHIFRHSHISNLADLGIPLRVIQKRVGHRKGDITEKIYIHVTQKQIDSFTSRVDELDDISLSKKQD